MCPGMFAATWDKPTHSELDAGYVCAKCGEFQVSWDQLWKCRSQGENKWGVVFCLLHCSVDQIPSSFVCSAAWHHKWKTTVSWVLEDPENVSGGGRFPLPTESAAPLNLPRISGWRWDGQSRGRRLLLLSASPTVCLMQTIAQSLQRTENEEQSLWTSHLLIPQNYNVVSGHFYIFASGSWYLISAKSSQTCFDDVSFEIAFYFQQISANPPEHSSVTRARGYSTMFSLPVDLCRNNTSAAAFRCSL